MIISNYAPRVAALPVLLLWFAIAGCSDSTTSSAGSQERKRTAHLVEIHPAEIQAVRTQLSASGSLRAERQVRIYNEISARVVALPWYPGDSVKQGEVIARLDDSIIAAELARASALKSQAESDYARLTKLKPKQLASAEEIAQAKTALDVAIADEKLQRTRLAQTVIRAPYDGVITHRFVEPGDVVPLHSHMLTLIDPDSLHLVVQLAEQWLPFISTDDHVQITIDALGASQHDGKISRIHPGIDELTRKGTVEIGFEPQPFGAQPGQLARARFYTRSVDRLVVPAHSLQHDSTGAFLYTLDEDNKAQKTYVEKGQQYGDLLSIVSGIDANSQVVSKGFIGLRNGKQVKIVNRTATAEAVQSR